MIANGDIVTEDDAAEALRRSGADGVMIGRGCYGRPWFPAQVAHFLRTGQRLPEPSLADQKAILLDITSAMLAHFGNDAGLRLARKHVVLVLARPARLGRVPRRRQPAGRGGRGAAADRRFLRSADRARRVPLPCRDATDAGGGGMRVAWAAPSRPWRRRARPRRPRSALLSALPVPVLLLDKDNRFRFANHAAEQFLGLSTPAWRSTGWTTSLPADNPIFLLIAQVREGEATISDHDLTLESPRLFKPGITVQGSPLPEEPGAVRAGSAGRLRGAVARPATGVPRRRAQRHRHGGDPGA